MTIYMRMIRITGNMAELIALDECLGIKPDENSRPDIMEWYWTMKWEDAIAAHKLLVSEKVIVNDFHWRFSYV